jgi:hypothetical protein
VKVGGNRFIFQGGDRGQTDKHCSILYDDDDDVRFVTLYTKQPYLGAVRSRDLNLVPV